MGLRAESRAPAFMLPQSYCPAEELGCPAEELGCTRQDGENYLCVPLLWVSFHLSRFRTVKQCKEVIIVRKSYLHHYTHLRCLLRGCSFLSTLSSHFRSMAVCRIVQLRRRRGPCCSSEGMLPGSRLYAPGLSFLVTFAACGGRETPVPLRHSLPTQVCIPR